MTGKNKRLRKSKKSFFRWQNWKKVVAVLAGVAVFATTYALILPAITLEGDAACGIEEHVHSEEAGCYETVLSCGLEEGEEHTHTDECYTLELICTQEEHTHTDECYAADDADESDEGNEEYAYSITGTSEDGLYTVTVSYSDEAGIPEDSVLEISLGDEEYDDETLEEILEIIYAADNTDAEESTDAENEDEDDTLSAASTSDDSSDSDDAAEDEDASDDASEDEDASEDTSSASVISSVSLDISIVSGDEDVEPATAVEVKITSADTISVDEDEEFSVVSISDEEVTLVENAELEEDEEAGTSTVTFEAESVSDSEYDLMVTAPGDGETGGGGGTDIPDTGGPGEDGDGDGGDDNDSDDDTVSYYHIDVRIDGSINYSTSTTKGETNITVTKEWEDDESTHDSVIVYLLDSDGNKILGSSVAGYNGNTDSSGYIIAVLSEDNDWTYTWTNIDLEAGSYSVKEETVSGYITTYEDNSITVTDTGEDSSYEYTGTLTVTSLTSVTVTDADTNETTTVTMNDTTTKDENSSTTTYEYQSTAGHSGNDATVLLTEGDTITLVLSFEYSYTDSGGNVKSGTVENFTYTVTVDDGDNVCDGESGKTNYGFDIVISAEYLLRESGVFNNGEITITNTKLPDIQIKKVGDSNDTVLGGAVFTLSKIESGTTYYYTENNDWSSDENEAEGFDTDGDTGLTDVISGLEYGTYYLTEIEAPDGYIALTDRVTITVTAEGVSAYYGTSQLSVTQDSDGTYVITVTNSAGYELPSTGGPGVWWLWTLGILVVGFVLLIAKRESMLERE